MRDSEESLVTPEQLLAMGSWRYPFFLVDKLTDFKPGPKGYITGAKNVTFNEPFFGGHFPEHPVMPGVLIAEVMAQTSDYLMLLSEFCLTYEGKHGVALGKKDLAKALATEEGIELLRALKRNTAGYLASQDLKYKNRVRPGDVLSTRAELMLIDPSGFVHFRVEARVGRRVACTGRIVNFRTNNIAQTGGLAGGYQFGATTEGA